MPVKSNVKKNIQSQGVAVPYNAIRQVARVGSFTEIRGAVGVQSR